MFCNGTMESTEVALCKSADCPGTTYACTIIFLQLDGATLHFSLYSAIKHPIETVFRLDNLIAQMTVIGK